MKKAKIGRRIVDVLDQEEYIRRANLNPEVTKELSEDTALYGPNDLIYPLQKQYSPYVPGVYDAGPILLYNQTEEMSKEDSDYHVLILGNHIAYQKNAPWNEYYNSRGMDASSIEKASIPFIT